MSVRDESMQVIVDSDAIRVVSAGETGPASLALGSIITGADEIIVGTGTGTATTVPFAADSQFVSGATATPQVFPVPWINGYSRGMNPDAADNSGAIQDVISKVLESALEPKFPALIPGGEFHITNDIEVPFTSGLEFGGAGRLVSKIIQDSNSTPILSFVTDPNSHHIHVHDLFLGYDTQQSTAHTGSAMILLGGDANAQAFSLIFERIYMQGGYRGIYAKTSSDVSIPWGVKIEDLTAQWFTGSVIHSLDTGGKPNWQINNAYIYNTGSAITDSTNEPAINLSSVQEFSIHGLDIEQWNGRHIYLDGSNTPVLIDGYHMENSTLDFNMFDVNVIYNSGFIARNVSAVFALNQGYSYTPVFTAVGNTGALCVIDGMTGGASSRANGAADQIVPLRLLSGATGYVRGVNGNFDYPAIHPSESASVSGLMQYNGDLYQHPNYQYANYTLTRDDSIITADSFPGSITMTLPAAASCAGKTYTIKRVSATANNVIVKGNGSELIDDNNTKTITTQFGFITVVSDTTIWRIIGSGGTIT